MIVIFVRGRPGPSVTVLALVLLFAMYAFIAAGLKAVRAFSSVLDHGQDIGLGTNEQAGREEVARQDRFGLGAQELRSARTCP